MVRQTDQAPRRGSDSVTARAYGVNLLSGQLGTPKKGWEGVGWAWLSWREGGEEDAEDRDT